MDNIDAHLWAAFKEGDEAAFEQIYRLYYQEVFRYGLKFTLDKDLIKDCIHDVFIRLHQRRKTISQTTSVKFYLFKALRNQVLNNLNQNRFLYFDNLSEDYSFDFELSIEEIVIQEQVSEEQVRKLQTIFQRLTKRQKEAIYLRFYANLDNQEIADIMKINYQSVTNLIFQGLKLLSQHLTLSLAIALVCGVKKLRM